MTPPEIMRVGEGKEDKKGWRVRVVPNLFPITEIHEVIIHSPDHTKDLAELPTEHVQTIFEVYQIRYNALRSKGTPLIFNNHGPAAGASLAHPHSQLTVIPTHLALHTPLPQKPHNIAFKGKRLVTFCPDFSTWPYETWIQPFTKGKTFGEIEKEEITELAQTTQRVLRSLDAARPGLNYNFYIYPAEDWYLRVIGRSSTKAGFELGSGIQVNTVDPREVVKILA
jgi:UDPglucose--hexose-1-phosphate uridylyltransferase